MLLLSLFGVSWVFPFLVKETLLGWRGSFVGKKKKAAWQVGPLCLFWAIWKARKKIAFEDSEVHPKAENFFCVFTVVGDQIVDKRWSFDLNRFYRLGGFVVREKVLGLVVRG